MDILQKALDALQHNKITLYEYRAIEQLQERHGGVFISSGVYLFFRDNNVKTIENGIGWRVTL